MGEGPIVEDVKTTKETGVARFPGDVYTTLVWNNPALFERKITQMARAALFGSRDNHSAIHHSAREKVARALNLLKDDKNVVNMKRKDIAANAGITLETVCRTIKDFHERGYVKRDVYGRKITLTDDFFKSSIYHSIQNS